MYKKHEKNSNNNNNNEKDNLLIIKIDITYNESVKKAEEAIKRFGVLVINTGYGLVGSIEELSDSEVRKIYDVNVFGVKYIKYRNQKSVLIKNISSQIGWDNRPSTPLPIPLIFPPPYCFNFKEYETTGKVWENEHFEVKGGKIEHMGEEFDITESKGSWQKEDNSINIRVMQHRPPNKIFAFKN
ncbi:hypothetical protein ACTFIU_008745 [Dictyostelium citrinum]